MIRLTAVDVHKYRSIQETQHIKIDDRITTIVGMNESGKTSLLTCLAKTNYFDKDPDFKFDATLDYPRSEFIDFEHTGEPAEIIACTYELSEDLLKLVENDLGPNVFTSREFKITNRYKGSPHWLGVNGDTNTAIKFQAEGLSISSETLEKIHSLNKLDSILALEADDADEGLPTLKEKIKKLLDASMNSDWKGDIGAYIAKKWIEPHLPKFWYFDEYYPLPGKINISLLDSTPKDEKAKTANALLEMARIKASDIIANSTGDYERFIAMLEASSNKITNEMFKYWTTNTNLDIDFKIKDELVNGQPTQKVLDIRVRSQRHKISLPLDRRSKGFNWFFSFIIWFNKIQNDKDGNYVLLLDEPGLNLHAAAQADLLRFLEKLSEQYQIVYTTHSPFMIDTNGLDRVRTCYETESGTVISDSIQEKDPKTLFPLQAALGYDIAQNLFISNNNLLVEGPADLIYMTIFSSLLESKGRVYLKPEITIIPVGGLDKVSTFISLLRGSKLKVACLLDTFTDQKGKRKVDDLIADKIIKASHVRFFDEFSPNNLLTSDIEDLFEPSEYLDLFNSTFSGEHPTLAEADLEAQDSPILKRINKAIKKERFNHYRPANILNSRSITEANFSEATLARFETVFKEINKLF